MTKSYPAHRVLPTPCYLTGSQIFNLGWHSPARLLLAAVSLPHFDMPVPSLSTDPAPAFLIRTRKIQVPEQSPVQMGTCAHGIRARPPALYAATKGTQEWLPPQFSSGTLFPHPRRGYAASASCLRQSLLNDKYRPLCQADHLRYAAPRKTGYACVTAGVVRKPCILRAAQTRLRAAGKYVDHFSSQKYA